MKCRFCGRYLEVQVKRHCQNDDCDWCAQCVTARREAARRK